MMTSGKLNNYLSEIDEQAEKMFLQLVKELADKECITEKRKAENQMPRVQRMNAVRETAMEIVNIDLRITGAQWRGEISAAFFCGSLKWKVVEIIIVCVNYP